MGGLYVGACLVSRIQNIPLARLTSTISYESVTHYPYVAT